MKLDDILFTNLHLLIDALEPTNQGSMKNMQRNVVAFFSPIPKKLKKMFEGFVTTGSRQESIEVQKYSYLLGVRGCHVIVVLQKLMDNLTKFSLFFVIL